MNNLDEYILSFQNYKDGNYEYETITSLNDIQNAILRGKKFVFTISGGKAMIKIGLLFLCIGITIATIMYFGIFLFTENLFVAGVPSLIMFLVFAGFSLRLIIPGLLRFRKSFIVLGPEGIVYKKKSDNIKGSSWEKINIGFYRTSLERKPRTMKITNIEIDSFQVNREIEFLKLFTIVITMPNSDSLDFGHGDYTSKEFPDKKQIGRAKINALLLLSFANYYNYRKKGSWNNGMKRY